MRIQSGDRFVPTRDEDGFPAVRVCNDVWVQDDRWITASAVGEDQEAQVRALAAALHQMGDQMNAARRARGGPPR